MGVRVEGGGGHLRVQDSGTAGVSRSAGASIFTYTVIGVIDMNVNGIALKLRKWGA